MYRIFLDNELFYDPRIPGLALTDISCELEVNKTGTLKFTVPPTHPKKDDLKKMYSVLSLYQDDDWLYSGRVLSDETDFYGSRTIECEGEMSYLLDSIQRYHEYHDISVRDYFTDLIANHNLDVESRKEFTVGQVTVVDNNDSLYRYSTYENTWKTIEDRLISRLGGYICIRHENGQRLIDYVESYGHTNEQVIRFGENILDLIQEVDCGSLATVIVPLGKRDEETDERLTIKSVNDGKDYIEDPDAIAKYGRIVKTVEYDDVELPENLLRKGREVLNRQKLLVPSITIKAIDLHLLDVDIERCKVGDNIRVISEPHGLDDFMVIQKIYLDLLHPENSKLTLGATLLTLASSMSRGTAAVLTSLQENFLVAFLIGGVVGGSVAGLPFELGAAGVSGLVMCMLAKIFLTAVFVAIFLLMSVIGRQRSWMSICLSMFGGMLLFMMIPMMTPLDSGVMNVGLCLAGGVIFAVGIGTVSNTVLKKISLVG